VVLVYAQGVADFGLAAITPTFFSFEPELDGSDCSPADATGVGGGGGVFYRKKRRALRSISLGREPTALTLATHLGRDRLEHLAGAPKGRQVDAAQPILLLGDAGRLVRLDVVELAQIPRAQVVRVLGIRGSAGGTTVSCCQRERAPRGSIAKEDSLTWIVTMSSRLKTESSMRSRQLLVLMQSRSIES